MSVVMEWVRMQFLTLGASIPLLPACTYGRLEVPLSAVVALLGHCNFAELLGFLSCCVARWPWACG